jgi:hypothetical protein
VLIVDSLIISGVRFVLDKLIEAVDAEMYDETGLREELLAAQMKLELGEIDDEEFAAIEEQVLRGLREIGERKRGVAPPAGTKKSSAPRKVTVESVNADFGHHDEPED